MQIFLIGILLINFLFFFLNKKIAHSLNLYDIPNEDRKIHNKPIPLTGGVIVFINVLYCFVASKFNQNINLFSDLNNLNIFFISCFAFWFLGFIDDKKKVSANKKFIIILSIIIINLIFDESIVIRYVDLTFFNAFDLGFFSYIWTVICFLLFINAFNMFDGINLQTAIYSSLICLLFIFNNFLPIFFIILLFALMTFGILNFNNKSFMGDSGTYLISYLFSYLFIRCYNEYSIFYADEIVLIMLIPGLDLIRLFTIRIINKKHPFSPDKHHLHHYLLKNFGYYKTLLTIQSLIIFPLIISFFLNQVAIFISIQILIYFYLIFKFKN